MTRSTVADCGHRERVGMIDGGECRDCRGVGAELPDEVSRTDNPHAEQASRHRIITGAASEGDR